MAALAALPYGAGPGVIFNLVSMFVLIMLASMWNLLAGYGGMMSIGLQAFYGLGTIERVRRREPVKEPAASVREDRK